MKRDWEIIRTILLRLEDAHLPNTVLNATEIIEHPEQEVAYNMRLLSQAGFIEAMIMETHDGSGAIGNAVAKHLTNTGHELLDTIRDDTIWSKVKDTFQSKGLEMTFDLVLAVGKATMMKALAL